MAGAIVTTNILSTMALMGLQALRENIVMAQTTNREAEEDLSSGVRRNHTVNISVPVAVAARTVVPDVVPPSLPAVTPTSVPLTMDQHEEAPFAMDDQALLKVDRGIIPMQLSEAVKSVANGIDNYIWSRISAVGGVFGFAGVPGTTPYATDFSEFLDGQKIFFDQLGPADPMNNFHAFDTAANANLLGLTQVTAANFRGTPDPLLRGEVGELLGFRWLMTQNTPNFTSGTAVGATTDAAGYALGVTLLTLASAGTGTLLVGDSITIAGDTQTYLVEEGDTDVSDGGAITIAPGLKVAITTAATAITLAGAGVVRRSNLIYNRNLIAFAMAPMLESNILPNENAAMAFDQDLGMGLRIEVTKQHHQYQWTVDALYGASVVRPELGVIIAG